MRDLRPLSDRFDLPYVRRKHFADRWTGRLGLLAALGTAATLGVLAARGNERPYTAGPLTTAHDMFASDCNQCHAANSDKGFQGLLMPASDAKCLVCHESQATIHADNQAELFAGGAIPGHPEIRLSSNCSACHVEHRGRDANLSAVNDSFCVRCHADLDAGGRRPEAAAPPRVDPAERPAAVPAPAPTEGERK